MNDDKRRLRLVLTGFGISCDWARRRAFFCGPYEEVGVEAIPEE